MPNPTANYSLLRPDAADNVSASQAHIATTFGIIDTELDRIADLILAIPQANVTGLVAALAAKIAASVLDANSILYATTDDTPAALAVAASRVVGRKSTGNIAALTGAEVQDIVGPYAADVYDEIESAGTSQTLNWDNAKVFDLTLDNASPCALTFTGGIVGKACWMQLIIRQDETGGRPAPSYTNDIVWDGDGNPPVPGDDGASYISAAILSYDAFTTCYGFGGTYVPVSRPINLPVGAAIFPDGSGTGNNPATPEPVVNSGTQTTNAPKATYTQLLFDPTTDEHVMWRFIIPVGYIDSGTVRLKWGSKGTTGNVRWKASVARIVDGSTDMDSGNTVFETVAESGTVAVPGTVGQTTTSTITLAGGYTAGQEVLLMVGRDADHASDTSASDATLTSATFEYRGL